MALTEQMAGLLTNLGGGGIRPDPMMGASIQDREIALQQKAIKDLRGNVQSLFGGAVETRTPGEQAQAALAQLDPSKKEDRTKILDIVSRINPERVPLLKEQFAARDEREAALKATQADRDRRFGIQEDTLKLKQDEAAAAQKLAEDTAEANNVLRQSYFDIAVADGNSKLAKLIASGMPLEKIQAEMFKGSDAVVKALTSDERESFDTLMESPVFETLADKIKEPSNYFTYVGNFSDELETVIYQRAKQLKQAGGMSDAQALKRALEETAANFPNKGGGGGSGGGGGGRKNRRTGGNVPEAVEGSNDMFSGTKGTK